MTVLPVGLTNQLTRSLSSLFPGFFPGGNTKHDHYKDFGFPQNLTFDLVYKMYRRNSLAQAAVTKTITRTWVDNPWLLEQERDGSEKKINASETPLEKAIRKHFKKIRFWQKLADADTRSIIGRYSALILRFADDQKFDQPVSEMKEGIENLVGVIPVWEGQLSISEWFEDPMSDDYGLPKYYSFSEASFDGSAKKKGGSIKIHPDRVLIWSKDGTPSGDFAFEAGFNDLLTLEKIVGAGGEGFWKNARATPVLELEPTADLVTMAKALGVEPKDLADKMNEQVDSVNQGFDKALLLQGMKANQLNVSLPSPEHYFGIALQAFAASWNIPIKILVGMQTGERASTEDAREWSQTINSRRNQFVVPNIDLLVERLVKFGILPEKDWFTDWSDLTESTSAEKVERASKMAEINTKMQSSGEIVFTGDEIREVVDKEPLTPAEKYRDEGDETDPSDPNDDPENDPPEDV